MRYKATISYDGAPFCGWQIQTNGISVQEVLEKAMTKTFGVDTQATASGRTDAGVHALAQVVHFDADISIPTEKIPFAVNSMLPTTISILSCEQVDDDFNARFSAKRKTYCYKIYLAKHKRPLLEHNHTHIVQALDLSNMKIGANIIEGTHDFKCFEATGSVIKNTIRTIYFLNIEVFDLNGQKMDEKSINDNNIFDCIVHISVCGNGFLYNMVRIIAGTLVYFGLNKITPTQLISGLDTGDRKKAGKTLPPEGLHLMSVEYP